MFAVVVNIDGLIRKFDTLANSADDLNKPLKQFGGYLRKRALERYKAQDFVPLAESTIKKRAGKGLRSMNKKLLRDVRGALKRARSKRAPRGLIEKLLTSKAVQHSLDNVIDSQAKGVRNRLAVLSAFQGQHRGIGGVSRLELAADAKPLSIKQLAGLGSKTDKAVAKAVGKPILGGLAKTLKITVDSGTVTLTSLTHQTWSDAHNAGDGHNPKRETIKLEESDLDVFGTILEEHFLLPFVAA